MKANNTALKLGSLIVAAVLGGSSCSTKPQAEVPSTETVRNVSVLAVKQDNIPDVLESVGTVGVAHSSDLAGQMMGNILEIRTLGKANCIRLLGEQERRIPR